MRIRRKGWIDYMDNVINIKMRTDFVILLNINSIRLVSV